MTRVIVCVSCMICAYPLDGRLESGCLRLLFFFKQKTADEMRIRDWSSDVCSSDLIRSGAGNPMENTQGSIAIEFRQGWGWLVLAALTISTIGDEITLL